MDAIVRPIDMARLDRDRRAETAAAVARSEALAGGSLGLSDTVVFEHPVVSLDEARRERERILGPGAGGAMGGPYKMLRTQVMRRLNELGANTLAVLSARNGEGKTLTAINLAIAVAAHWGHTALLVDLDLRNPNVHKRLGIQPALGIEDCLLRRRPIYEAMIKIDGYERLTVLPARGSVGNSSELLGAQCTADLMQELRTRYQNRVLVFDLPPVLLADDALAFSMHVQAGLFVVAECHSTRESVNRSLALLHKLPIVGTVLNRSQESLGSYY